MPSHSKLTCKKFFRGLLRVIPFRCPSVASRNPFAPFLDPVHVPHVRSFWLSWTPYEDPRGSCGNILRNSLLIPYFTVDRPSRILRSDFTYPWISSSSYWDLSISGTTLLTIFWARTPGLWQNNGTGNTPTHIPSPWSGSSGSCHRPAHSVAACLLPLPPFGCRCFLKRTFPLEASSRLIQLCRRLLSTTSTSTAVWVLLWFRYGVFFLYLTIFLICSASQIGCFSFVTFLVTVVRFPLFRSPVSPHGVTQNNDRSGFFPSPPRLTAILARFEQYLFVSLFQMFLKSAEAPVISVSEAALIPPGDGHTNTLHVFLRLRVSESQVSMERVI